MPRRASGRVRADLAFSSQVEALPGDARAALEAHSDRYGDDSLSALARYASHVDRADATLWSREHACDELMCCPDMRVLRRIIAEGLRRVPSNARPPVVRLLAALDARTESRFIAAAGAVASPASPDVDPPTDQRPT